MYCKRCGSRLVDGGAFCARCGTPTSMHANDRASLETGSTPETNDSDDTASVLASPDEQIASADAPQVASSLRFVEVALAVVLLALAFLLPVFTVGATWTGNCEVRVAEAVSRLFGANGDTQAMICGAVIGGLLVLGVGATIATIILCFTGRKTRHLPWSWGMAIYGLGLIAVAIVGASPLTSRLGEMLGQLTETTVRETVSLGMGTFAIIAGGVTCGMVDLVRSQRQ